MSFPVVFAVLYTILWNTEETGQAKGSSITHSTHSTCAQNTKDRSCEGCWASRQEPLHPQKQPDQPAWSKTMLSRLHAHTGGASSVGPAHTLTPTGCTLTAPRLTSHSRPFMSAEVRFMPAKATSMGVASLLAAAYTQLGWGVLLSLMMCWMNRRLGL